MIGQTISHYRILEKLGEGGMGVVYKARDTKLDRDVALKFLPANLTADPESRERFVHEAKAASALSHPNICGIHAIEEYEQQHFIDMEFLDGKTLSVLLKERELSLKEIVDIALQIAEGLIAAHKKGIVHRDIKPDNIMVTDEHLVKIMDFGLAKLKGSSELTKTRSTLGTLSYMSPEQAQGVDVDHRSDIFSFGVILFEMVTGRRPFKGEHEAAIIYSLVNETPEPLARYRARIPDELQRVVNKALAKDRDNRYQHVDEMATDLRRVLEEVSGRIISTTKKSKMPWVVATCVMLLAIFAIYIFYPKSPPVSGKSKSIAVLPFTNMSDSKEDEYFSDGLTEDIITQLSKIRGIEKVIARTSVMRYKESDKSVREIAKELDVATVLEGSVRRVGNQIRIVAQLIDAESEGHLWAETYDKELTQIFAIQSDVAQRIAAALKTKLSPSEKEKIEKKQTENTEAYQLCLKGRFYWNKRNKEGFEKAIYYFNQAIGKDPAYALAYAGLADVYAVMGSYFLITPKESVEKARAAAQKSLAIDEYIAEPHAALAAQYESYDWDWSNAEREYRRAIDLNPNYATAHQWYGEFLSNMGRLDEGVSEIRKAQELDPLSPIVYVSLGGWPLFALHRYDEGIQQLKKALEIDANFSRAYFVLGQAYLLTGKHDDAILEIKKAIEFSDSSLEYIAWLGFAYGNIGQKNEAEKILGSLLQLEKRQYVSPYLIGEIYIGMGEKDSAFIWLNRAVEAHDNAMEFLKIDPTVNSIRGDGRFAELMKKVGLLR